MADHTKSSSTGPFERDVDLSITSLKKGAYLLKYGRRGKPKFCPFRLSSDETMVLWFSGKVEKHLKLNQVSKIIPGQRTAIFARHPRPEKEYQSFSLIYGDRSLDLICKDKDEAEAWFVGLKAIIARNNSKRIRSDSKSERLSADSRSTQATKDSATIPHISLADAFLKDSTERVNGIIRPTNGLTRPANGYGNLFSDVILYTAESRRSLNTVQTPTEYFQNHRISSYDSMRASMSSAVSSSSHGSARSGHEDFDSMGDVIIWGDNLAPRANNHIDISLPRHLESTSVFDVQMLSCGAKHAILVTKQGEVYSWGVELGGRLGHGTDCNVSHPKLVSSLSGLNVEHVACGEFHTCAVTQSGDLYTWGDGVNGSGLLGHGNSTSHWIPKQVCGPFDGLCVTSVSCGPWHTAVLTSSGKLFTFGDGAFGTLGHGDRESARVPREVEAFKDMRVIKAVCGVWHTAAIVEITDSPLEASSPYGKLFTWGDGDKYRLGHGDKESKLVPTCVAYLSDMTFHQVACGVDMTVALSISGKVYTMGSVAFGQLGHAGYDGKLPRCVEGKIKNIFVEEISCGSHHVAVLTSKPEVYTWGKGANGRLGHGDENDQNTPTLVEALADKQVKNVVCGADYTAVICLHKWASSADQSVCSGCRLPFGFRRKRHNCYNCGLVFCKACSGRKAARASLAPNMHKPYRVCDDCYMKLKKPVEGFSRPRTPPPVPSPREVSSNLSSEDSQSQTQEASTKPLSRVSSADLRGRQSTNINLHPNPSNRLPPSMYQWGNTHSNNNNNNNNNNQGNNDPNRKIISLSLPASRAQSRSASPLTWRLSPQSGCHNSGLCSPELFINWPVKEDEASRLRSQVEELTRKSEILEVELEKTSNKLREATTTAEEETEKNKAANEVIMSLTTQLREITEHLHDGTTDNQSIKQFSFESQGHHSGELNEKTGVLHSTCSKKGSTLKDGEWVEQVEPGVYITVTSNSMGVNGEKFMKRVRFSRKKFTEQQAESWWANNKTKLKDKYGITCLKKSSSKMPNTKE